MTLQTSLQALQVYRQALANPAADLTTTAEGNVRIASLFDRAINRITDLFRKNPIEDRREQARQAIRAKFQAEVQLLGQKLSTPQRQAMDGALNMLIDGRQVEQVIDQLGTAKLSTALRHIREVSEIDRGMLGLAWQATTELVSDGHHAPDASFARRVAELTLRWKKELHLGDGEAYRLAFNAAALYKRHGIEADDAREILQLSGRLRQRHGLSADAALQFAIDLQVPMQKAGVRIPSLERLLKGLLPALPELAACSPRTRISAALCYLQLQDASSGVDKPIDEVGRRLSDLKALQALMPRGCVIDQIHQGCHVRGTAALDDVGLQRLSAQSATLADYPNFDGREVRVTLPDAYRHFEQQFVKDLVRGYEFELKDNGHPDASFIPVEHRRRASPGKLAQQDYTDWASHYQRCAGSVTAAGALSRLQSQTFFGDVEVVTRDRMANADGYAIKAFGDQRSTRMQFAADRRTTGGKARIDLRTTQSIDARILRAEPAGDDTSGLPRVPEQLTLLPTADWLPDMRRPGVALVRDCVATIALDALDAGSTTASVRRVSETWDLVPDWDAWMQGRASTL